MVKALFFDIDGTLVSFRTHEILASTIEAIRIARTKNIKIFISTGRPKPIINNLHALEDTGLIDGYITMNGAYCFTGDTVISKSPIPAADVCHMAELCESLRFPCIFVNEQQLQVCHPDKMVKEIFQLYLNVAADAMPCASIEEVTQREIFQMTPFLTVEEEQQYAALFPHCESNRWYPAFTDLTKAGTTKQKGVDDICRYFNIEVEETMSFGDGGNDISMLRHTGIGVAMGNAKEATRQAADYVTSSVDDDGVWNALKHFKVI